MKKIFAFAIFSILAIPAFTQTNLVSFQYSIGFGTGSMHDFISPASFRGFTVDYRKLVQPSVGVGFDIGWNVFYDEMPDAVYDYQNVTFAGKQWRYSNHFPMLLAADYYLETDGGQITPYGGLGLGTMYSVQNTDMGTYTFEKEAWHFVLRPELGVLIKPSPNAAFTILSKYYYGFKAGDLPAQGFVTINVGIVLIN